MRFQWTMVCCLLGLLITGCQDQPKTDATSEEKAEAPAETDSGDATPDSEDAAAKEVTLEVKSWAEVQDWVKTQQGKVVVVDVWSTSCPPCIAEFPNFVALQSKYPEEVVCASVSLDYTGSDNDPSEDLRERILGALKKLKAGPTVNFLSSDQDEEATKMMEVAAIPVAFVYDKNGELAKKFTNDDGEYPGEGYTYNDHIVPLVDQLVQGEE